MENHKSPEVIKYLRFLFDYLAGDFDKFKSLCLEVELAEAIPPDTNLGSMFDSRRQDEILRNNATNQTFHRLTIPMTLSLFSAIDCLGYLSGNNNSARDTYKNFREFFKQSSPPIDSETSDIINNVYRQGLSHFYFPKLNLGVSYRSTNPIDKILFKDSNDVLILNVNNLAEIVFQTFKEILEKPELTENMELKYNKLITEYKNNWESKVKKYVE